MNYTKTEYSKYRQREITGKCLKNSLKRTENSYELPGSKQEKVSPLLRSTKYN